MKSLILGAAVLCTLALQAQNQNVTDVSKTTVTTIKDSDGEKKTVKSQNVQAVQNIELQNADSKELNKDILDTPVQVTSSIQVTAPDGSTRIVDVDRSANYTFGGNKYRVSLDNTGYTVTNSNGKKAGVIRKTANGSYIFNSKNKTSVGHFDAAGNFVLETYDDNSDRFITEIYKRD